MADERRNGIKEGKKKRGWGGKDSGRFHGRTFKKIVIALSAFVLLSGTSAAALAEGGTRAAKIQSKGNFVYEGGDKRVAFYSEDLITLAKEIDKLESDYDKNIVDSLAAIGTYFDTGKNVTHDKSDKAYDTDNAMALSFDRLLKGIRESQTIEKAGQPYTDSDGNQMYQLKDGTVTVNGEQSGAEAISIQPACADNLSAGTQAWVNGVLLTGTGNDAKSYYDAGVNGSALTIVDLIYSGETVPQSYALDHVSGSQSRSLRISAVHAAEVNNDPDYEDKYQGIWQCEIPIYDIENESLLSEITMTGTSSKESYNLRDDAGNSVSQNCAEAGFYLRLKDNNGNILYHRSTGEKAEVYSAPASAAYMNVVQSTIRLVMANYKIPKGCTSIIVEVQPKCVFSGRDETIQRSAVCSIEPDCVCYYIQDTDKVG